jgi:phosphoglycolate phosphatase
VVRGDGKRAVESALRLLVFDLDGTLVDSKADLVGSVNATLRHLHEPELPEDVIASYIGDGAPMLIRRALGIAPPRAASVAGSQSGTDAGAAATAVTEPTPGRQTEGAEEAVESALRYFLDYYREHLLDRTRFYPGVREALDRLAHRYKLAVLTNKPVRASRQILAGLGAEPLFCAVYGGNSFATKKPSPEGLRQILAEAGAQPDEAVMIGDSANDVRTGRNAGVWTCGVQWGIAVHEFAYEPPDWIVSSPQQWPG